MLLCTKSFIAVLCESEEISWSWACLIGNNNYNNNNNSNNKNNNNNNNSDTHKELLSTELPFIVKSTEKIECNNHVNTQTFF